MTKTTKFEIGKTYKSKGGELWEVTGSCKKGFMAKDEKGYEFAFTPEGWFFNVPGANCDLIWEEQPQDQPQDQPQEHLAFPAEAETTQLLAFKAYIGEVYPHLCDGTAVGEAIAAALEALGEKVFGLKLELKTVVKFIQLAPAPHDAAPAGATGTK